MISPFHLWHVTHATTGQRLRQAENCFQLFRQTPADFLFRADAHYMAIIIVMMMTASLLTTFFKKEEEDGYFSRQGHFPESG